MSTIPDVELQAGTLRFLEAGPKKLFINNEWVAPAGGESFATINPANGQELMQVALAGAEDVDQAVSAARAAYAHGPWPNKMSGQQRGQLLWKVADLIEHYIEELADLETLDNGKPRRIAHYDMVYAARHFRYYAGWAGKTEGTTIPVSIPNQFVYTLREPMGVVGLIIPWNFPLLMCAWKLAPALACGNTAILKPAEQTPLTALRLAEIGRAHV